MFPFALRPAPRSIALVILVSLIFGASATARAEGSCSFPANYAQTAANAGWSFNPPACPGNPSNGVSSAPTPNVGPNQRIDGTGGAPAKLPYLRHPAGGDPVMADGEFVETRTDVALAGYGLHYEFTRTYRSRVNFRSPLGFGWDHNYNQRILGTAMPNSFVQINEIAPACDQSIDVQDGGLNRVHFTFSYSMNGSDYYESKAGVGFTLFSTKDSKGNRFWTIHEANGVVRYFGYNGYLAAIVDPAGNRLDFSWEPDVLATSDGMHGPPLRLQSVKDAARTVTYIYSTTDASKGVLQCITLGTDCTADEKLLVVFNVSAPAPSPATQAAPTSTPNGPELLAVYHGTDTTGEQYVYFDQAPDAAKQLDLRLSPTYCLNSDDVGQYCKALCSDPVAGDQSTCTYAGLGTAAKGFCTDVKCHPISCGTQPQSNEVICTDPIYFNACEVDKKTCWPCVEDTQTGHCTLTSANACYSVSGSFEADSDGTYAPCCVQVDGKTTIPGTIDASCLQYLQGGSDCLTGCQDRYQCQRPDPSSGQYYNIYSFGSADDLRHDIVKVIDEKGQIVVVNTYGTDPANVAFDKVISQQLGPSTGDNTIGFDYHDLKIEAGQKSLPSYGALPLWPGPYSTSDSIVVNPFSDPATWNAQQLCPNSCNVDTGCPAVLPYAAATTDASGTLQDAWTAVVIHDLHGRVRVQYLDQASNILRELRTDTGEVTDYNYDELGFVIGVRAASGIRTCNQHDDLGRTLQSTVLPAGGHQGDVTPEITLYDYDSFGRIYHVTVDPLGTPSVTTYTRNPDTGVLIRTDQDVGPTKPKLTTLYRYDGEAPPVGLLETPTQIQYPNGRIDLFSGFDPSMGGPTTTVIDASSDNPEQHYAVYDARGRIRETGERPIGGGLDRYAEHYTYDDGDRLSVVAHRMDSASSWINKTIVSHNSGGEQKIDSITEPLRKTSFDYIGPYPKQQNLIATAAPVGTALPATKTTCFNHSADGRLEETAHPEGNSTHYNYYYETGGSVVVQYTDPTPSPAASWNANCPSRAPTPGDQGATISAAAYSPGGILALISRPDGYSRILTNDGFGRPIQSDNNYWPYSVTPDDQVGYDVRGRTIWTATYKSGAGIATDSSVTSDTAYHHPQLTDTGLLSFSEFEYDFLNRKTKETRWVIETGEALITQYDFDDQNATLKTTDRGATTFIAYDGRGRMIRTTLPDTSQTTVQYSIGQDVTTIQTNTGSNTVRTRHYDTRGRLLEIDDENNQPLASSSFDDDGDVLTSTPAGSGTRTNTYDSFDRLIASSQDLGNGKSATSQYQFDRNDRRFKYIDAEGHAWTTLTYTSFDKPITFSDPLGRPGNYGYSYGYNLPASLLEPNGRQTSFRYSTDGHLKDIFEGLCPNAGSTNGSGDIYGDPCTPLQVRRHYEMSPNEHQVAVVSAPATGSGIPVQPTVTRTYDSLDRPIDEAVGTDSLVHHSYTDLGRTVTTQVTYSPDSSFAIMSPIMTHHYDAEGRLQAVDLNSSNIATWNYGTGVGGPLSLVYANGATTQYSYDSRLRQTGMDVTMTSGTGNTSPILSLHDVYGRDSTPRMRQRKFGGLAAVTDVYQVDSDSRMIAENLGLSNIVLPTSDIKNGDVDQYMSSGNNSSTYTLDGIGNIDTQATSASTAQYTVDALSRVTAVEGVPMTIDNRDNLTGLKLSPLASPQYTFDEFSGALLTASMVASNAPDLPPTTAASVSYKLDAMDRRIAEDGANGEEDLLIWDGLQIIARGPAWNLTLEIPTNDLDGHVASVDQLGTGVARFYHQGPDKSVAAISDTNGFVEGYSYSAFGTATVWTGGGSRTTTSSVGNRFMFQGQLYDSVTSTYSFRTREYSPQLGRFLSADPLSIAAGPNRYAHSGSRPLRFRDPTGMVSDDENPDACLDGNCTYNFGYVEGSEGYLSNGMTSGEHYIDDSAPNATPEVGATGADLGQIAAAGNLAGLTGAPSAAPTGGPQGNHYRPASLADRMFHDLEVASVDDPGGTSRRILETTLVVESGIVLVYTIASAVAGVVVATGGAASACMGSGACFVGDTQVLMADGTTKAIESLKEGDLVAAEEPGQPQTSGPHRITHVYRTATHWLIHIKVAEGGEIEVTPSHPFWTERGWVKAEDLRIEDVLSEYGGKPVAIRSIARERRDAPTFNLTVEGTHTYFVVAGGSSMLVHNSCCDEVVEEIETAVQGNSLQSTNDQHVYEILQTDAAGETEVYKYGISGGPLTDASLSQRAETQVSALNRASDEFSYSSSVIVQIPGGPGARAEALDIERQLVYGFQEITGAKPPGNIRP